VEIIITALWKEKLFPVTYFGLYMKFTVIRTNKPVARNAAIEMYRTMQKMIE